MYTRKSAWIPVALLTAIYLSACGEGEAPTGSGAQGVAQVTVTPENATLGALGETQQFTAGAKNATGDPMTNQTFIWTSSAPEFVEVDATGLAMAVGYGAAAITATADGVPGSAVLIVEGGSGQPSQGDALEIADEIVAAAVAGFQGSLGSLGSPPAASAQGSVPGEIHIEFEIVRPCPLGGEKVVRGRIDGVFDPETESGEFELHETIALRECSFEAEDGRVFTVHTGNDDGDGGPIRIDGEIIIENGEVSAWIDIFGVVRWETEGEGCTCVIDLVLHWTPDGHVAEGSVCGRDVGGEHDD